MPWVIAAAALAAAHPARAQANLDAGKSAAQIFADTCNACHRSPREIRLTSAAFLREHYTTGAREAAAMAAYLASVGSDTRAVQQRRPQPWARARRPRRGPTRAMTVGRRSRANPRQARPRRAQSGLVVPPRAWKRAICRPLSRREARPRLVRRKLAWRHPPGPTPPQTSPNS